MNPWLLYLQVVHTIRTSCNVKMDLYILYAFTQTVYVTDHKIYFTDVTLRCSLGKVYLKNLIDQFYIFLNLNVVKLAHHI